jgi:hypothetical protein
MHRSLYKERSASDRRKAKFSLYGTLGPALGQQRHGVTRLELERELLERLSKAR